ncbi:MAG: hypothetical protein ACREBD_22655 [Blastocatellia bacterium]
MIAVMGATGHTGKKITEALLRAGETNEAKVKPREGRTPENTMPTRFEDFASEFARAYQAA